MNELETQKVDSQADIIDVASKFYYSSQDEEYNKEFKNWRKDKKNPYGYNFIHNIKERIYVDGKGFVDVSPRKAEEKTISKISLKIGIALLISLVISTIGSQIAFSIANLFGADISNELFMHTGNPAIVALITAIITVLQYAIPAIFLCKTFKLPEKVAIPHKIQSKYDVILGVSEILTAGIIVSTILLLLDGYLDKSGFIGLYREYVSSFDSPIIIVYFILDVICVPFLIEILFRASMFQVLRQFGDWFSIIVTSILSILILNNLSMTIFAFILPVIISIFTMRSGSIKTAVLMSMVYRVIMFFTIMFKMKNTALMVAFMITMFIIGVLGILLTFKKVEKKKLVNNGTVLTMNEKIFQFFSCQTICIWVLISIVISIFTL